MSERNLFLDDGDVQLYRGDCVEVMRTFAGNSVDAIVTDPPYGLEFMGKEWDAPLKMPGHASGLLRSGPGAKSESYRQMQGEPMRAFQAWCEAWAVEALRVLRPGGHLLAFGGTRTYHRLTTAIEDAGFEIRDCLNWVYGSGFPKSLDVSKAIDREAGVEREKVQPGNPPAYQRSIGNHRPWMDDPDHKIDSNEPATPEAAAWQGWGTALKPAHEPIVLARKPLAERTVARQVLATGTGALNVDGTRVGTTVETWPSSRSYGSKAKKFNSYAEQEAETQATGDTPAGRWPPNLLLTHDVDCAEGGACVPLCPVAELDRQSGHLTSGSRTAGEYGGIGAGPLYGQGGITRLGAIEGDAGGASRFFPTFRYCAKADTTQRDGATHPTVKPLALMRWLVKLMTPPGGTVLDPFAGSGTTLLAARNEGFKSIGIERELEYCEMAAHRLRQLSLFA
jgi:DNA modification methylase